MRRSRALVIFGGLLTIFAVATVSVRSQAANQRARNGPLALKDSRLALEDGPFTPATLNRGPRLLPVLAKVQTGFEAFIKPVPPPEVIEPAPTAEVLPTGTACPGDMIDVEGDYCPYQEQRCLRWLDLETKLQCAEFEKAPSAGQCGTPSEHKHFCIDRYEWPNQVGMLPTYMASWTEAKASCESIGKRLCSDTEWTLACEGPQRQPYPYGDGYERDDRACNIDKPYIWPDAKRIYDPKTQAEELARLDQREPSGSREACVSPYGVRDMVGNVDEWVVNVSQGGWPFQSGLKGGYWGPVRTRCRPMTTGHDEQFRYYQIGFRCCGEARIVDVGDAPVASR